ncbi:hypothetical protein HK096_000346, partial [Nowakowskiella sp. JEL0078]
MGIPLDSCSISSSSSFGGAFSHSTLSVLIITLVSNPTDSMVLIPTTVLNPQFLNSIALNGKTFDCSNCFKFK